MTEKSIVADADSDFATAQMTSAGAHRRASLLARNEHESGRGSVAGQKAAQQGSERETERESS